MSVEDEAARMTFVDLRDYVKSRLGTEEWVTLYRFDPLGTPGTEVTFYCALAQPDHVAAALDEDEWDLLVGDGRPGFESYSGDVYRFVRAGDGPVEPFIHSRSFEGPHEGYNELSEEFRLFHNLAIDQKTGRHFKYDEAGDEVDVARVTPDLVQVRLRYLKEYLAARDMCLLIFFEYNRVSSHKPAELGVNDEGRVGVRDDDLRYDLFLVEPWFSIDAHKSAQSIARMRGKKVVRAGSLPADRKPWEHASRYESFVIGTDEDGNEVDFTCDDEHLSNYFGKNPDAPHYLTPVFFRKQVLGKYYSDAKRYKVTDSYLQCVRSWGLRIDNNHSSYVTVFLGDLSHLPHKEQLYWKSFNVVPDGGISATYFQRSMLGAWVEPEAPDLLFKARYQRFGRQWFTRHGWYLFKPLKAADAHYFDTLHVPSDENQAEFDNQVMALAKVMIERINESELKDRIQLEPNDKGIRKLEKFLISGGFLAEDSNLKLLRNLQDLRSGPAHVKGKTYDRAVTYFQVEEKGYSAAFSGILSDAVELLGDLTDHFGLDDEANELADEVR